MKRLDGRIIVGLLLILGGGLLLAQEIGLLANTSDVFWGSVFLLGGAAFLYVYAMGQWWGAIPGMTLVGVAGAILLPEPWGGAAVLAGIGLAFWLVYLGDRQQRWWAIIPGGVMVTLSLVAGVADLVRGIETGGIFFLGLAATFALVALLANMRWAWWPAAALSVIGMLLSLSAGSMANYVWAVVLILAGGYLIFMFFRKRES
jgi:hypothetical protein